MVLSNNGLINNIIHLNDKIKNNVDQKKAIHILHQMRLLVNHMTLNLHDLNKDIYNENQNNVENQKYYYMTMYESLINSIKSMISMYENNLLNNDENNESVNMMNLENISSEFHNVDIAEKQKKNFLDDLKKINGNDSILFNPQNLIEQIELNKLKDKVQYHDNIDNSNIIFGTNSNKNQLDTVFTNANVNDSKHISNNLDPLFNNNQTENRIDPLFTEVNQQKGNLLDSLFANNTREQKPNLLNSLFSNNNDNDEISNFKNKFSENEVANSLFGNLDEENATIKPKKKIKIVLVLHNKLPHKIDSVWNNFKKLDKSDCIKLDANKHSHHAENIGFDFKKDFELKKIDDGNITNFEDEITLDKLVNFSKDSESKNDLEDLMQSIDYDNTLTLYHNPNCGYCVEFYPIWDQVTELCKNKPIQLLKVDCNENSSMCSHILGTPTIIFKNIHSSKTIEFEGEKTIDDLMKFIDIIINLASLDNCSSCGKKHKNTSCNEYNNIIDIIPESMNENVNQHINKKIDEKYEQYIDDDMHNDFHQDTHNDFHKDTHNDMYQGIHNDMQQETHKDMLQEKDTDMHEEMHNNMYHDMNYDMNHNMHNNSDQGIHSNMNIDLLPHDDVFKFEEDNSNMLDANKPIIIFYHKNDCEYSRNFENTWNQLQQLLGNQVLFIKKNYDELNDNMKDRLSHVPTIELILDLHKDNKIYRYGSSSRSVSELIKFIRNPELGQLTPLDSFSTQNQNGGYANNDYFTINRMQNMYGGDKGKIILFYADWCGHCQQFKPLWEKIKRKMGGKVQFKEVDDENVFEINKYGVQGYPTIIAEKGGKMFKFNNNRTEDILIDFIEQKLM